MAVEGGTSPTGTAASIAIKVLGGFGRHLAQGASPRIRRDARELVIQAGGSYRHGQFMLPAIPGSKRFSAGLYTNTNALINQWAREYSRTLPNAPPSPPAPASSPPLFPAVDTLPRIPPFIVGAAGVLDWPAILAPIIAGALFWPTAAGPANEFPGGWRVPAVPRPVPTPGGRTRGRRGRRARPRPRPVTVPRPRYTTPKVITSRVVRGPAHVLEDIRLHGPVPPLLPSSSSAPASSSSRTAPASSSRTVPAKVSLPVPGTLPKTLPRTIPGTSIPLPTLPQILDYAAAALPFFAPTPAARLGRVELPGQFPSPNPQLAPNPLTAPYSAVAPYAAQAVRDRDCSCTRTKTRKKKPCSNPVTSSRKSTRGGHRYVTVTRRIECPASSRKKP